ncbi:hypothetical protein IscW_ISCW006259, partial [Ixodes scapularis]
RRQSRSGATAAAESGRRRALMAGKRVRGPPLPPPPPPCIPFQNKYKHSCSNSQSGSIKSASSRRSPFLYVCYHPLNQSPSDPTRLAAVGLNVKRSIINWPFRLIPPPPPPR